MQVVILSAGKGTRMKKLSRDTNKNMLKVKGKPILEYKIDALPKKITEVVFIVGYHCEHIMKHFRRYFKGRKITYVFQHNLNGTGGAVHLAKSILKDKFLVMMGDDLYHKKDLENIIQHDLAILGYQVDDPSLFGVIKTDEKGRMTDVIEKPKNSRHKLANTGVYVLNKDFFDYDLVPIGGGEFGLPQTMAKMAADHKIKVVKARAWHPIGSPEDLKKAEEILHKFI
jgi:NDP-sugar pyrophosphorylase family protein